MHNWRIAFTLRWYDTWNSRPWDRTSLIRTYCYPIIDWRGQYIYIRVPPVNQNILLDFSAIMGLFAICSRSGVMGIITAVFAGISTALSWLWVKFCMLFLMWSMRQNEYLADEFAYKIGFGLELATVLDQHISDVPHDGFLSAIYSTHPCNDDRVAALQNLGVPYSRY